jgi:homoserine kinase
VIGLALSNYLEIEVTIDSSITSSAPLNCTITYEGEGASEVPLSADENLVTRVALYVLRCHNQRAFPSETKVHIKNPSPLGRGLGSSGAAVVGGVMLGNEVGKLGLSKARMLDYCLMIGKLETPNWCARSANIGIERHPDNVAAALYGGFVGTYLKKLSEEDKSRKEIPLAEVLPEPAGGKDTGEAPPEPPVGIGHYLKYPWSKDLKAIAVIPNFHVPTALARSVLPKEHPLENVTYNAQRLVQLPPALGASPPVPADIYFAMQDAIHQPYRMHLIPGLPEILETLTPETHPGLCGVCLSGAGPTILAVATTNFEEIANAMIAIFKKHDVVCEWKLLEPANDGATVSYS